jgi:hypothetical protein
MGISLALPPLAWHWVKVVHPGVMVQSVTARAQTSRSSKPSGRLLDRVVVQEAAQSGLALDFRWERRLCRINEANRHNIADSLMRALGVVMFLDLDQCSAKVRFAQQNQIIERFTNFSDMPFGVRIAERGMRRRFEDAQVVGFQYPIQGQKAGVAVMNQIPAR